MPRAKAEKEFRSVSRRLPQFKASGNVWGWLAGADVALDSGTGYHDLSF
jgi:hypothetical protein